MSLADEKLILEILKKSKIIAIIGLSRDYKKESHKVARYLQNSGYKIIPINPFRGRILNENCYKDLLEIPNSLKNSMI